jgi:hypothetical protein
VPFPFAFARLNALQAAVRHTNKDQAEGRIGCFFHLKQAWRKYLIEKCHLSKEHVTNTMQIGMLDLLCIIPIGEVEEYGIPYLRSILEKDASKRDLEKWQTFWT